MTAAQADLARRLVASKGRDVTFIRLDNTAADATKPWRGAANSRATPEATAVVPSVFVPPSSMTALGFSVVSEELVRRCNQIAICAPGSSSTDELESFHEIIDFDTTRWKIVFVEILRPATTRIVYFVGVAQ